VRSVAPGAALRIAALIFLNLPCTCFGALAMYSSTPLAPLRFTLTFLAIIPSLCLDLPAAAVGDHCFPRPNGFLSFLFHWQPDVQVGWPPQLQTQLNMLAGVAGVISSVVLASLYILPVQDGQLSITGGWASDGYRADLIAGDRDRRCAQRRTLRWCSPRGHEARKRDKQYEEEHSESQNSFHRATTKVSSTPGQARSRKRISREPTRRIP